MKVYVLIDTEAKSECCGWDFLRAVFDSRVAAENELERLYLIPGFEDVEVCEMTMNKLAMT